MSKRVDIKGKVFGKLEVIKFTRAVNTHAVWEVKCLKCESLTEMTYSNLKSGNSEGCQKCKGRILTKEHELAIKIDYAKGGVSMDTYARDYGVAKTTIHRIIHR